MKRAILYIILGVILGGGAVWLALHEKSAGESPAGEKPAAEKPAGEEEVKTTITHDPNGNVVIGMSDEVQGDAGIVVKNPEPAQFAPELKGYGRVMDPTALAALFSELASDQAASTASSNELVLLKTLAAQGNTSPRNLRTAEAAALHDQIALQSVKDRLMLGWGKAVSEQSDPPAFIQSLLAQEIALVRIDLPAGENLKSPPTGARVVTLSEISVPADFLGTAAGVDPQNQGLGFVFLVKPNTLRLLPGQGVTGYLRLPDEPLSGVVVSRDAVVRTEGKGWVYVLNSGGESFTRREIPLDRPTDTGWFVSGGVTATDYVVVTGAQALLSEELKGTIKAD